jgi:hypothetical protein
MSKNLDLIKQIKKDTDDIQKTIMSFETALNTQTLEMSNVQYLTASKTLQRLLLKEIKPKIKSLREKQYRKILKDKPNNDKNSIEHNLRMIYAGYPYMAMERLNKIISNSEEPKEKRLQALFHLGKFHINGTLGSLGDNVASDLSVAVSALIKSYSHGNQDAGYWIGRIEEQLLNYKGAITIYNDLSNKNNELSSKRLAYININSNNLYNNNKTLSN